MATQAIVFPLHGERGKGAEVPTGHRAYVAQRKAPLPTLPGAQLPALAWVLKVENTLVVCVLPHCGQGVCSTDGGRTFNAGMEQIVYRHEVPSAQAPDGSTSAHAYLMSMARFTFGHPCGVALGPDRALLAWYGGSIERTAIHSAVVRLIA